MKRLIAVLCCMVGMSAMADVADQWVDANNKMVGYQICLGPGECGGAATGVSIAAAITKQSPTIVDVNVPSVGLIIAIDVTTATAGSVDPNYANLGFNNYGTNFNVGSYGACGLGVIAGQWAWTAFTVTTATNGCGGNYRKFTVYGTGTGEALVQGGSSCTQLNGEQELNSAMTFIFDDDVPCTPVILPQQAWLGLGSGTNHELAAVDGWNTCSISWGHGANLASCGGSAATPANNFSILPVGTTQISVKGDGWPTIVATPTTANQATVNSMGTIAMQAISPFAGPRGQQEMCNGTFTPNVSAGYTLQYEAETSPGYCDTNPNPPPLQICTPSTGTLNGIVGLWVGSTTALSSIPGTWVGNGTPAAYCSGDTTPVSAYFVTSGNWTRADSSSSPIP